jgi:hypothetical protein
VERHLALACAGRMQACARHTWTRVGRMGACEASRRSLAGAWRRVQTPMKAVPPPNGKSVGEESKMVVGLPFWRLEARVLGFEQCSGTRARE